MLNRIDESRFAEDLNRINRREILKMGLVGALAAAVPLVASTKSAAASTGSDSWRISFRNSHTGESFSGVYRVGDKYLPEAFHRINYVLRDFRTKEVFPMDPRVIDFVKILHDKAGGKGQIDVLSGYRSPRTNTMLRGGNARSGVAKNSLHMYGQAMDIRLNGYNTRELRNLAVAMKAGGVGYYPRSNFVHVDTGDVRSW